MANPLPRKCSLPTLSGGPGSICLHHASVDLLSGAGGLSLRFAQAGFRLALAVDTSAPALKTLAPNHPEMSDAGLLCEDVRIVP